jgi:aspartyl-tRNA(Asn)/glutamyl-tRNA(Gln) amidotransferase subunit A
VSNLADLNLTGMQTALRERTCSSRELVEACLGRIRERDGRLGAFLTLTPELALDAAAAADRLLAESREDANATLPALLGLPLAVKDLLCLKDVRCTCGSRILENFVPPFTATSVQRLLNAGAATLGKTNTDEFAMGSSTENSAYQLTCNPWDLERVPGGSSGGSAAAVAGGLVPAALGTDTGGSVRQPAAFCGLTGIKPTYGRVSRYGLVAYGSSLDCVGVLAHNAQDAALVFQQMAGFDPLDATSMDQPLPLLDLHPETSLKGLRLGVPKEYFVAGIQPGVEETVHQAVSMFASLGVEVFEISLPHTEYALPVYYLIAPAEASANLARYDGVRFGLRESSETLLEMFEQSRGTGFGAEVKRRIMLGTYALSAGYYDAYYGRAQKVRTLIKQDFEQAFQQVDLIAAPVAPSTAFRFGEHSENPLAMYLEDVFTLPANLAGVPALAFPVGFADGLPVGMQLMGPHFREDVLFAAVHAYQQVTGWHLRRPELKTRD